MNVFAGKNCVFDTRTTEPWFPASMPPLAIFYGTLDTLVLGKPLVERIRSHEPNVRLVKAVALENYGAFCFPAVVGRIRLWPCVSLWGRQALLWKMRY